MFYSSRPPHPELPPGYVAQFDTEYQTYYYVNTATGESSWEPPKTVSSPSHLAPSYQQHHQHTSSSSQAATLNASADTSSHMVQQSMLYQTTSQYEQQFGYDSSSKYDGPPPSYNEVNNLNMAKLSLSEEDSKSAYQGPVSSSQSGSRPFGVDGSTTAGVGLAVAGVAAVGAYAYHQHSHSDLPPPPGPELFYGARHAHVVGWGA